MSPNFVQRLDELPGNLSNHLMISVSALAVGVAISLPLAIWLVRRKRLRYPILTVVGVVQTIPSLALLALMVPLLDKTSGLGIGLPAFGLYPAVIALTLYSILPVLRNTVTGILGVDPALIEAARGVGMTRRQVLWKVELPLAAPVIIAGVRTATVWVVGIATLATPVGQRCLGNYIFTGLQTRNWMMVMFGVVAAAALAVMLDGLMGALQKAVEKRRKRLGIAAGTCLVLILAGGLVAPAAVRAIRTPETSVASQGHPRGEQEPAKHQSAVRIGAKTFTEQYILAALIDSVFIDAGFQTHQAGSLGSTVVFDALAAGELDVYVDYSGTVWANYMKRPEMHPRWQVLAETGGWLAAEHGVRQLGTLGFENAYALVMRRDRAEALGVRTISDLVSHAPGMKIGGDYEFFGRPDWTGIQKVYGLRFADRISFDSTLMYPAVDQGDVDVISAYSSDGRIDALDLVVLEDDLEAIPPYDAVLLLGPDVADRPDVARVLQPLLNRIPVEQMRAANLMVDREKDKQTVEQAAEWLGRKIGILEVRTQADE